MKEIRWSRKVPTRTCVICGFVGAHGLGYWSCHGDADTTPVCRGSCWREYEARKKALRALAEMGDVTA